MHAIADHVLLLQRIVFNLTLTFKIIPVILKGLTHKINCSQLKPIGKLLNKTS